MKKLDDLYNEYFSPIDMTHVYWIAKIVYFILDTTLIYYGRECVAQYMTHVYIHTCKKLKRNFIIDDLKYVVTRLLLCQIDHFFVESQVCKSRVELRK